MINNVHVRIDRPVFTSVNFFAFTDIHTMTKNEKLVKWNGKLELALFWLPTVGNYGVTAWSTYVAVDVNDPESS